MSVYLDDARLGFRRMTMSHLMADTLEELHAFADRLGLKREWFQGDHYDLAESKRAKALKLGAIAVTQRQMVEVRKKLEGRGPGLRVVDGKVSEP